jgi:hypothetical protein
VSTKRFSAELYEGHSDCAVIVPFDPSKTWDVPTHRIGYRKYQGYAVRGTASGKPFESWIWFYFHQWRMVIPDSTLAAIDAEAGKKVRVAVSPHPEPEAVAPYKPGPKR